MTALDLRRLVFCRSLDQVLLSWTDKKKKEEKKLPFSRFTFCAAASNSHPEVIWIFNYDRNHFYGTWESKALK